MYLVGIYDYANGISLLQPNMTKALEHLEIALEGDFPVAFHIFGEIIHYE